MSREDNSDLRQSYELALLRKCQQNTVTSHKTLSSGVTGLCTWCAATHRQFNSNIQNAKLALLWFSIKQGANHINANDTTTINRRFLCDLRSKNVILKTAGYICAQLQSTSIWGRRLSIWSSKFIHCMEKSLSYNIGNFY